MVKTLFNLSKTEINACNLDSVVLTNVNNIFIVFCLTGRGDKAQTMVSDSRVQT